MTMKTIKAMSIAAVTALTLMSAASFAQSVSVTSSTLDGAEAKIAAQAQEQGAQYKITGANTNNRVHMTAELYK
jgi:TolB-like protein